MKKSVILFCTKPVVYLTELPLIILLGLAIRFNNSSTEFLKLYPLIIVASAAIIFLFVYFFRVILINTDEVKIIGRFSSRDKAVINKGKRLVLTLKSNGRLTVELFGNDGKAPELDWAQSNEDYVPMEINLFRESCVSGVGGIRRVLSYFGITDGDISNILTKNTYECEHTAMTVRSEKKEDVQVIEIGFTETI